MTPKDYRMVGIGAVSLSLFIGIWDWLHTRNVDRSAPRVPEPKAPPTEEDDPVEGTIARLSKQILTQQDIEICLYKTLCVTT